MKLPKHTFVLLWFLVLASVMAWAQNPGANAWEPDIRKFEAADSLEPPPKGGVLFVGSSSIRMWETLREDFPELTVVNRGFGGCELADVVHFAGRIVLPYAAKTVIVYAGDNDLANGKTPEQILSDYKQLVRVIHEKLPETRVGYISIKPSFARWNLVDKIRKTNSLIRKFSSPDRLLVYIDVFTPMLGKDGKPRKELFAQDGLHLNRDGYALWRDLVKPVLQ